MPTKYDTKKEKKRTKAGAQRRSLHWKNDAACLACFPNMENQQKSKHHNCAYTFRGYNWYEVTYIWWQKPVALTTCLTFIPTQTHGNVSNRTFGTAKSISYFSGVFEAFRKISENELLQLEKSADHITNFCEYNGGWRQMWITRSARDIVVLPNVSEKNLVLCPGVISTILENIFHTQRLKPRIITYLLIPTMINKRASNYLCYYAR